MVFYEPSARDRDLLPHDPFKAIVAPRPIGWISTRTADGTTNLAPYSFFNAVGDRPPMVMFSSIGMKDTASLALESGEFCWNLVSRGLAEQMNATSRSVPRGTDEAELAGLELAPGELVGAPRVVASHASLECVVVHSTRLRDRHGAETDQWLVVGEVVGVHVDPALITAEGRFDTLAAQPLMRGGYVDEYLVADTMVRMTRPA